MAGWDVAVVLAEPAETRALRILGVEVVLDLQSALSSSYGPMPHSVLVSPRLYESDVRIREGALEALGDWENEIELLGNVIPDGTDREFVAREYRMSSAARAFKSHALAALSRSDDAVDSCERFLCIEVGPARRGTFVAVN